MIERATKILRHRQQTRRYRIRNVDWNVDNLSQLRRKATSKCLVDQAHCISWCIWIELSILDVGAEVQAIEVIATNVAAERYWMKCIHPDDLRADFVVVVGVEAIAPVRWDSLASVPDILSIDLVGTEERHHRLAIYVSTDSGKATWNTYSFISSTTCGRHELVQERRSAVQQQGTRSEEEIAIVSLRLVVTQFSVQCQVFEVAVALTVAHHLSEQLKRCQ